MERTTFVCDVCGTEKKEANHWWVLIVNQFSFRLTPMEAFARTPDLTGRDPQKQHLCGQTCAIRKLAEFMSGEPAANPAQPQWTEDGPMKKVE